MHSAYLAALVQLCVLLACTRVRGSDSINLTQAIILTNEGINFEGTGDALMSAQESKYSFFQSETIPVQLVQQETLGKKLRELYINKHSLAPPVYKESNVFVSSDQSEANFVQLQSLMLGLFPLGTGQLLPNVSNLTFFYPYFNKMYKAPEYKEKYALPKGYQSIPILKQDRSNNSLFHSYDARYCKAVAEWEDLTFSGVIWGKVLGKWEKLIARVKTYLMSDRGIPLNPKNATETAQLITMILQEHFYGIEKSQNIDALVEDMQHFLLDYYTFRCGTSYKQLQVSTSPILSQLYSMLNHTVPGMCIYNINLQLYINLFQVLGLNSLDCLMDVKVERDSRLKFVDFFWNKLKGKCLLNEKLPIHGSSLIIEVWTRHPEEEKVVRIRVNGQYQGKEVKLSQLLKLISKFQLSAEEFHVLCNNKKK